MAFMAALKYPALLDIPVFQCCPGATPCPLLYPRTPAELQHRGNEGLQAAVDDLELVKQRVPGFSFAGLTPASPQTLLKRKVGPA